MSGAGRGRAAVLPAWMSQTPNAGDDTAPGATAATSRQGAYSANQQDDHQQANVGSKRALQSEDGDDPLQQHPQSPNSKAQKTAGATTAATTTRQQPQPIIAKASILPQALRNKSLAGATAQPGAVELPLPPGWAEAFDETYQHPYWYNASTGERTWQTPEYKPPMPPGWSEAIDPTTGTTYFFNTSLGLTQWDRPTHEAAVAAATHIIKKQHAQAADPLDSLFTACPTFSGARPGYVFKIGPRGVGYYVDSPDTCRLLGEEPLVLTDAPPPSVADEQAQRHKERAAQKLQQQQQQQQQRGGGAYGRGQEGTKGRGRGGGAEYNNPQHHPRYQQQGRKREQELDPMDPSSYSDAPKGGWGVGLENTNA